MELKTASSVINYLAGIESRSANWYTRHARNHSNLEALFGTFAGENHKFAKRLKKAYYSGVTDALETNFSFQGLEAGVEIPQTGETTTAGQLLGLSLELEKSVRSFYLEAADLSRDLLADVPRAMERVGRARDKRIDALRALQQQI